MGSDLAAYVRTLVERAPGHACAQFNRVDFRRRVRHVFPEATIVHLYRHPRDRVLVARHGTSARATGMSDSRRTAAST